MKVKICGLARVVVAVLEEYPGSVYTDYVALLKLGGEWKIVNKVYVAERK